MREVRREGGRTIRRLDVLINNAGLGNNGSVVEGEPENWRTMFAVNTSFRNHKTARASLRRVALRGRRRATRIDEDLK